MESNGRLYFTQDELEIEQDLVDYLESLKNRRITFADGEKGKLLDYTFIGTKDFRGEIQLDLRLLLEHVGWYSFTEMPESSMTLSFMAEFKNDLRIDETWEFIDTCSLMTALTGKPD